jgi:hypothetical protein
MTFSFESTGLETSLSVVMISIQEDETNAFDIVSVTHIETSASISPPYSSDLPVGDHIETTVTFTPVSTGTVTASFLYVSNAHNEPVVFVPLQGTGVQYEPNPGELLKDAIATFEMCVEEGSLYGVGNGNSGLAHLRVFEGMLDSADDLFARGDYQEACDKLAQTLLKSDGRVPPPGFIAGGCASTVNSMLTEVSLSLDCN